MGKNIIDFVAWILVIAGALNWGIIGVLNLNLADKFLSSMPILSRVVYVVVGVAGIWIIFSKLRRRYY